jgi:hypothetical protein
MPQVDKAAYWVLIVWGRAIPNGTLTPQNPLMGFRLIISTLATSVS